MATLVTPKIRFLHVPKTGGTWVTQAIIAADIPTRTVNDEFESKRTGPNPRGELAPISPAHADLLDSSEYSDLFTLAFVRHPLDWWRSHWCHRMTHGWVSEHEIDSQARSDSFPEFIRAVIERLPGYLNDRFNLYVGPPENPISYIGRFEHLQQNLLEALYLAGEKFNARALMEVPPANVGNYDDFDAVYPVDLGEALADSEQAVIDRFYDGVRDPSQLQREVPATPETRHWHVPSSVRPRRLLARAGIGAPPRPKGPSPDRSST